MGNPDPATFKAIGQALRRKEDLRLLTGKGRFTDDFRIEGQVYAAMVRSPHAHARIMGVDAAAARAMPGVLGVFTGADCAADGLGPIPHDPVPKTRHDLKLTGPHDKPIFIGPHLLLPVDKARHAGEAVAMVVAETLGQALDAAEAVAIEYEELPWVSDQLNAIEPDAPLVWAEAAGNLLVETVFGDPAATERAIAAADHRVRMQFHVTRVTAAALEPRSALADFDKATGRYTLYAGSGGAVRQKNELATVLGILPDRLRVLSFDVGGNFGSKNRVYVEFGLVLWAAAKIGRPVKYTATRSEAFISDYQGRDLATTVELALANDGRFLAMRAVNVSNVGARCVSLSPLGKGSALITGSYDIPVAALTSRAVFTNTTPTQAYRSSGRPEVNFALERLIDTAASRFGFDRIELRRKNLVRPGQMPYLNALGATYDSGEYENQMDLAMRIADWDGFPSRKAEAEKRGKLVGRGLANYVESSIGSPRERAEVTVLPEGRVDVVVGTQPSGQGHETSFAQVAADLLGVPVETINIILGDTDVVRLGGGTHSGRSMRHAATVMTLASKALISKVREIAASVFETDVDAIEFRDGRVIERGTNHALGLFELASEAERLGLPKLAVVTDNEMHDPVFPNGCAVCEAEVDPETGHVAITRYATVDDVGRCINPMIVHGQTHGGIAQGLGEALWEECAIDGTSGQPLCGSFMDYGMPRADTMPTFRTEIAEVLSPTNPLGIKAGGEGGTTPALSVTVNAIVDALREYGVEDIRLPATSFAVWQAIRQAKREPAK